jgi:hypothetical protein
MSSTVLADEIPLSVLISLIERGQFLIAHHLMRSSSKMLIMKNIRQKGEDFHSKQHQSDLTRTKNKQPSFKLRYVFKESIIFSSMDRGKEKKYFGLYK